MPIGREFQWMTDCRHSVILVVISLGGVDLRFSIRGLFQAIFVLTICSWLTVKLIENQSLKTRLSELRTLDQRLVDQTKLLADRKMEFQHFAALSNAQVEPIHVALDAQRRQSSSEIEVENIRSKICHLLLNENGKNDASKRKLELIQANINRCRTMLGKLENDPSTTPQQIALIKKQINHFKTESNKIAK